MQHRRHRVGDTLDDYCPRERRLTTHAVVAMVEDEVKQTRCTTCDFEHVYKGGKVPPRRKPKDTAAPDRPPAENPVPSPAPSLTVPEPEPPVLLAAPAPPPSPTPANGRLIRAEDVPARRPAHGALRPAIPGRRGTPPEMPEPLEAAPSAETPAFPASGDEPPSTPQTDREGSVHRRLIRATLPRVESQVTPRPLPEFTIRQPQGKAFSRKGAANRFGGFRQGQGQGRFGGNGNGSGRQDGFMMHDRSGQGGRQPHPHGQRQGKKRPR
ncbi:MAG: hypothetical protein U0Q12_20315 [Vicinamibacterales bacterium]